MTRTSSLILITAFASVLAAPAQAAPRTVDRVVQIADFDRLRVDGSFTIELTQTNGTAKARIAGPSDAADRVSIVNQGSTLVIRRSASAWGGSDAAAHAPVVIRLQVADLRTLMLRGGSLLRGGPLRLRALTIANDGAGRVELTGITAETLLLNISGSGSAKLAGTVASATINLTGSGGIEGDDLSVKDLKLVSQTSGNVSVTAIRQADVTALASGNVTILGSPACTVRAVGSGEVVCGRGETAN